MGCSSPSSEGGGGVLRDLRVTGGHTPYPPFDPGIRHYAVRCAAGTELRVTAQARSGDARLTLRRADPADERASIGSLDVLVGVNGDRDIAIEVSDRSVVTTYYVHCIPPDFPHITIEQRTEAVTDGLLLMTPHVLEPTRFFVGLDPFIHSYLAIVDNHGVPRWVRPAAGLGVRNLRRYADGRYSHSEWDPDGGGERAVILDRALERIGTAKARLQNTGGHDFLITENGNYLFMSHEPAVRDLRVFGDRCFDDPLAGTGGPRPCTATEQTQDSVIQEVTPAGAVVFTWNSWDHLKISDCGIYFPLPMNYAIINALHLTGDGDIVASFRGCNQVLMIDRPTGDVVWQLGGTAPTRSAATEYLRLTDDPAGEFCGQHTPTITGTGSLLMFDNGSRCRGLRKNEEPFSRVVEYDLSTAGEARLEREYRIPGDDLDDPLGRGHVEAAGAVVALASGNWLISGGLVPGFAALEVDAAGNVVFRMRIAADDAGRPFFSYRVYRERETDIDLPLNLPP